MWCCPQYSEALERKHISEHDQSHTLPGAENHPLRHCPWCGTNLATMRLRHQNAHALAEIRRHVEKNPRAELLISQELANLIAPNPPTWVPAETFVNLNLAADDIILDDGEHQAHHTIHPEKLTDDQEEIYTRLRADGLAPRAAADAALQL